MEISPPRCSPVLPSSVAKRQAVLASFARALFYWLVVADTLAFYYGE